MLTVGNVVHCAQKFKVHSVLLWEAGIHTSVAYLEVLLVKTTKAHQRLQILLGKHAVVMSINYLLEIVGTLFSPSHCHICASVALPWTNVGSTFILYVWIHSILRRCLIQQIRTCQLPHQIRVRLILFSHMTSQSLFLMNKAGTEDKYDSFQTKPTVTSLGKIMLTRGDTDIKQHTFKTLLYASPCHEFTWLCQHSFTVSYSVLVSKCDFPTHQDSYFYKNRNIMQHTGTSY